MENTGLTVTGTNTNISTELQTIALSEDISNIITRNNTPRVFDDAKISKIANFMPEIHRATTSFGRSNSQTTMKLMSLTMLQGSGSPIHHLKQILAESEKRKGALSENLKKIRDENIEIAKLETNGSPDSLIKASDLKQKHADGLVYIEGALKDLAGLQDVYQQIKEGNNIPDNWDEKDFEEEEPKHHVRMAFQLLYRDIIMTGRANVATLEYLAQFGVHAQMAIFLVNSYIKTTEANIADAISRNQFIKGNDLEVFLDQMAEQFKYEHKDVLTRMGIKSLITEDILYKDAGREEERLKITN